MKLKFLILFLIIAGAAAAQSLPERERELVRTIENAYLAARGDSAAVMRIRSDWQATFSPMEAEIPENTDGPDFTTAVYGTLNEILSRKLRNLLSDDRQMDHPFSELQKEAIRVSRSADGRVRVFSWDDMQGGTMRSYRNIIQYYVNDSVTRIYFPLTWVRDQSDEVLDQTSVDTVMHLRGGIYLLQGEVTSSTRIHGVHLLAFDIRTGVMKKAYPFCPSEDENRAHLGVYYEMDDSLPCNAFPLRFILDGERLHIPQASGGYTEYEYNGAYFEDPAEKRAREAGRDSTKYMIARILFKDAENTRAIDEVIPAMGITLVTEIAHSKHRLQDIEGEDVQNELNCSFYKGSPTIRFPHLPVIDGYTCIENLDIEGLCRTKRAERWSIRAHWGRQRVSEVAGPDEAMPYQKVRYTVVRTPRKLSKKQARQIHWAIVPPHGEYATYMAGDPVTLLDTARYHGAQIELTMLPEWEGGRVRVIPFIGDKFRFDASYVTQVTEALASAYEGGLQRIAAECMPIMADSYEELTEHGTAENAEPAGDQSGFITVIL